MSFLSFHEKLKNENLNLLRDQVEILQVNIGRLCNQACHHCHVEAGPLRTENMGSQTVDRLIELIAASPSVKTIDITGGAPELNPHFRKFVTACHRMGKHIIDRCNLTVLFEPGHEDTAMFLKKHSVHIIASLPCYSKDNVEKQRGRGVFNKSIEALKILNSLGYGITDSSLKLDLVYNPTGPSLPPEQKKLEDGYKKELKALFNIEFNNLFTITNMPIKRFLDDLGRAGKFESYMDLLANNFNPHAVNSVMCKSLVSVSWDGTLFDCDFNQMLELPLGGEQKDIWSISSLSELTASPIALANHCYACTAGAGSSCSGSLT